METINLVCTYEERTSKKDTSKKYKAIFIKIAPNYEKMVLVSVPEQALIESNNLPTNDSKVNPYNFSE